MMQSMLAVVALDRAAKQIPGLRRLPVLELMLLAQVALLVHQHIERLTPRERHRVVVLFRDARGWPPNLPPSEREELDQLFEKAEPKLFAAALAETVAPFRLAERFMRRS